MVEQTPKSHDCAPVLRNRGVFWNLLMDRPVPELRSFLMQPSWVPVFVADNWIFCYNQKKKQGGFP
jgi:hypothetical protein